MISNFEFNFALNRKSILKHALKMLIKLYAVHMAILLLMYLIYRLSPEGASIISIILIIIVYPISLIGIPSFFLIDHLIAFSFVSLFPLYCVLSIIYSANARPFKNSL